MQKWSRTDLGKTTLFPLELKRFLFNVYQRVSEKPVLRILKKFKPDYSSERFLIKDRNGNILNRSENLDRLINKTSWNKIKLVK